MIPPQYMYTTRRHGKPKPPGRREVSDPISCLSAFYDVQGDGSTLGSTLQHRHCFTMTLNLVLYVS